MNAPTSDAAIESLNPNEIAERLTHASIAYLPLGSLEFHGPHLPIGLDALTARGVCLAASNRTGGIVLPAVYFAVGGEHTYYPWTLISREPGQIETLLSETLARLNDLGVRRAVLLSGHFAPAQQELITRVADTWNTRETRLRAVARTLAQAANAPVAPDHAGQFETLLLYALNPNLVKLHRLPDQRVFPAPEAEDPFGPARHNESHPLHGIFGPDPRTIDFHEAGPLLEHFVGWVADLATRNE
ncbi:creatininase family protein [Leifsonia sp. TF02-11]|uniref:creatininase family protein n=1 Tax=Leifsonia sp. TF02-11 TaxID=2815212 RepID=UPI001AA14B12|nr:creatininase family protein [Leifsonia sp. TF02-11]MBO1741556.1 creatininase family protein [Leifsonia sp. TF02-11]